MFEVGVAVFRVLGSWRNDFDELFEFNNVCVVTPPGVKEWKSKLGCIKTHLFDLESSNFLVTRLVESHSI